MTGELSYTEGEKRLAKDLNRLIKEEVGAKEKHTFLLRLIRSNPRGNDEPREVYLSRLFCIISGEEPESVGKAAKT